MTAGSLPAAVRRLWPQKLRTRLATFYSLLFLAAGLGLLVLAYALAMKVLVPTGAPRLARLTPSQRDVLLLCKPEPTRRSCWPSASISSRWSARRRITRR